MTNKRNLDQTNINRLVSEELLSNDRRVEKHLTPPGFVPLTSRFITICTSYCAILPLFLLCYNRLYISNNLYFGVRAKMKNESVKKLLEKSKTVLEEKRKMVKRKICIKNQHAYKNCP